MFHPEMPPLTEGRLCIPHIAPDHPEAQVYLAVVHAMRILPLIGLIQVISMRQLSEPCVGFSSFKEGLGPMHALRKAIEEPLKGDTRRLGTLQMQQRFAQIP